ncbi:MAG: beta-1,6-N-acetylglucosaminyltransferase [Chthoniobacterales bacterium]
MKIAYLVVAHRNPVLLRREIYALISQDADFFVHIDGKRDLRPFEQLKSPQVIFLEKRWPIHWAGFSIVRAILSLMSSALRGPQDYDYFVLLGASEYPLRSRKYIHDFFEEYRGSEFIDMVKLPNELARKPLSHVNKYCLESSSLLVRRLGGLVARFGLLERDYRKHCRELEPYGGEMWWALTRGACEHILQFTQDRPEAVKFFHNVQVPDETFIHTVLGNSAFAGRIRRNLCYRDWSGGGRHPATISERHLTMFAAADEVIQDDVFGAGEALFARKFSDEDLHLLDRIDQMIATKEGRLGSRSNASTTANCADLAN